MIDQVARETRFAGNPPGCADELPGLRAGSVSGGNGSESKNRRSVNRQRPLMFPIVR